MLGDEYDEEGAGKQGPDGEHRGWHNWIEVTLAGSSGSNEIGVRFVDTCPYDLFQAMVPGYSPDGRGGQATSSEYDGRYWR